MASIDVVHCPNGSADFENNLFRKLLGKAAFRQRIALVVVLCVCAFGSGCFEGTLKVISKPPGARVYLVPSEDWDRTVLRLEERYLQSQNTPFEAADVDSGSYELVLKLDDIVTVPRHIRVRSGRTTSVRFDLCGTLAISSDPAGARVYLIPIAKWDSEHPTLTDDYLWPARTPTEKDSVLEGAYKVVAKLGDKISATSVHVRAGSRFKLSFNLEEPVVQPKAKGADPR